MPRQPRRKAKAVQRPKRSAARKPGKARTIRGRGDYTVGNPSQGPSPAQGSANFLSRLAEPFVNNTASVGLINKGARFAGNALGNWTGIPGAGAALGNAASYVSRLLGFGDYKLKSNCLATEAIAQFKGAESTIISGKEFVTNISGSAPFTNQTFIINPGNSVLFPWLSTVARNYENWEPMGIVFEYRTTSAFATGTTNSALGTVIQATDYDVIDTAYTTKQQMLISTFSNSQAPCTSFYHPIECASQKNPLGTYFVQTGNSASSYPDDPRFSAIGNYQIATEGMQVTNVIGELWVSYKFKFSKPQLPEVPTRQFTHISYNASGQIVKVAEQMALSLGVTNFGSSTQQVRLTNLVAGDYMMVHCVSPEEVTDVTNPSSYTPILEGGATILFHSVNEAGIYGVIPTNMGMGATVTSVVPNRTLQFTMFRMFDTQSAVRIPVFTFSDGGLHADVYVSGIPRYSEGAFNSDNFYQHMLKNKAAILEMFNSKDEVSTSSRDLRSYAPNAPKITHEEEESPVYLASSVSSKLVIDTSPHKRFTK